jgi:hypothetical protein
VIAIPLKAADLLLIDPVIPHLDNTTATITWLVVAAEGLEVPVDAIHLKVKTEDPRIINRTLHQRNDDPALLIHHSHRHHLPLRQ